MRQQERDCLLPAKCVCSTQQETHLLKRSESKTSWEACSKDCPAMPLSSLTPLLTLQLQKSDFGE